MNTSLKTRLLKATLVLPAALLLLSSAATGEVSQKGGVRIYMSGKLTPTLLPRHGSVPIGVSIGSRIVPSPSVGLPQLSRITIALNENGRLNGRGLPVCRLGHIDPSTTAEARRACGGSLIGEGSFTADVRIPEQSPFPSKGKILAFNGRLRGKPAIFAHVYGTEPVPTSIVLPFSVSRTRGTFGTLLEAALPRVTGDWGYVTGISLTLNRTFFHHGHRVGYISAGCPAPPGFDAVVFPLAKTTLAFAGGLSITSVLERSCRATR